MAWSSGSASAGTVCIYPCVRVPSALVTSVSPTMRTGERVSTWKVHVLEFAELRALGMLETVPARAPG